MLSPQFSVLSACFLLATAFAPLPTLAQEPTGQQGDPLSIATTLEICNRTYQRLRIAYTHSGSNRGRGLNQRQWVNLESGSCVRSADLLNDRATAYTGTTIYYLWNGTTYIERGRQRVSPGRNEFNFR